MKLYSVKSVSVPVIAIALLSVAACTSIKKSSEKYEENVKYEATPKVLELHGDSVAYDVAVTVPAKKIHKRAQVKLEPVLQYGSDASSRPPQTIKAEKAKGKSQKLEINSKTGGTVTFSDKFAYDPKMKNSTLFLKPTYVIEGDVKELDQCITLKDVKVADGIITTSQMLKADEDKLYSVDEYVPMDKTKTIELYYLINSDNFNPNFKDNQAGFNNKAQIDSLESLLQDPNFELKGITINSYASPDGSESLNEELSNGRSESTVKWFKGYLKKKGRTEVFDSSFTAANHFKEDWKGWKAMVQASDLNDKDAILSIMDNNSISDEEKEARIRSQHAASFEKMKVYMLPKLRRSALVFSAKGGLKSNEELTAAGNTSLDDLSQDEELQLGKITTDSKERERIYNHYVGKYNTDWRGYNNLAVANLQNNKPDEALTNLKKADELSPNNAFVLNNMGVAYKMKKQYMDAEEKYRSAKSKNNKDVNPDYNLGVLYTRVGKYDNAIESFKGSDCRYNVGLAYLLKKDYANAEKTLNCIPADKKDAETYYLMAVVAARKNSTDGVVTNLSRSFSMDASMKAKAKEDLEFRDFRGKAEFENLFK